MAGKRGRICRKYTPAEWEDKREIFRQLYMEQKLPLRKAVQIMGSDYGFKATARMYKQRIEQWGFRKNCNAKEAQRILRSRREKEALGSVTDMTAEQTIDQQMLFRYMKWKMLSKCSSYPPRSLSSPEVLQNPEIIITSIIQYVSGSFEVGTWFSLDSIFIGNLRASNSSAFKMYNYLVTAFSMLEKSNMYCAGLLLSRAFSLIEDLILEEDPSMLPRLFQVILPFSSQYPDIISLYIRHFSNMASVLLAMNHPLCQILMRLYALESSIFESTISVAWESTLDQLQNYLTPGNVILLDLWIVFAEKCGKPTVNERISKMAQKQLDSDRLRCDTGNIETLTLVYVAFSNLCSIDIFGKKTETLALKFVKITESEELMLTVTRSPSGTHHRS
ncbi:Clr5 domain-containing protein [Xylogone sp. PMI_703]|nr:Clr5 domain-containing protein [Xylogone sp. PMI_703]